MEKKIRKTLEENTIFDSIQIVDPRKIKTATGMKSMDICQKKHRHLTLVINENGSSYLKKTFFIVML